MPWIRAAPPALVLPLLLAAAPLAAQAPAAADTVARRVTALADEYVREYKAAFPETASFAGFSDVVLDRFSDNSPRALAAWQRKEDAWAAGLARVDARALWGRPEWTTFGFLREAVESSRQMRVCRNELWGVNHMSGWQTSIAQMAEMQPVGTPEARALALRRWADLPRYVDAEIANLREGMRQGYTAPRRLVTLVLPQLDAYLAVPADSSPLASPAARDSSPEFRAAWRALVRGRIDPALRRYRVFLAAEYLPRAREALGVAANPNGRACWQASFRSNTTLDRAPEETFRLGEETVARYAREAVATGQRVFGTDDIAELRARIATDPRNRFTSRDELLAFARDNIRNARQVVPRWFSAPPAGDVVVEPFPAFMERTASSRYEPAQQDGSRPAVYRIKLFAPEEQQRGVAEITAYHETYPGHHLQIAIAQKLPALHPIGQVAMSGAYVEGWARYAEALAEEMGLYSPAGQISRRLWPGHGMVVDPGLHLFGWTRERAVRYMEGGGRTPREAESLVDRIAAWPGQLTSYDTGALEIFALRARAQRELGPRFDLKAFHDAVLNHGAVTLPMLREQVDRWIAAQRAAR